MNYQCSSTDVERLFIKLEDVLRSHGAFFHPDLVVREDGGNLFLTCSGSLNSTIRSPAGTISPEHLICVPESCLPPVDRFELKVQDNAMVIENVSPDVPKSQLICFEIMLEVLNCCGKLEFYAKTNPWLSLNSEPEFLNLLIQGRGYAPKVTGYHDKWQKGQLSDILLQGFLGSRYFGLDSDIYGGKVQILMPFIDYLNHHNDAMGYQVAPCVKGMEARGNVSNKCLFVNISRPLQDSRECFVKYNFLDPLDSLLIYGFVDESAYFCRSVPLDIDFSRHFPSFSIGIHIETRIGINIRQKTLPKGLKDLRNYLPTVVGKDKNGWISLSHLMIPSTEKAPRALRRVLKTFIGMLYPDAGENNLFSMVLFAEKEVLLKNISFYRKLSEDSSILLQKDPGHFFLQQVDHMSRRQLHWLQNYCTFHL